MSFKIAALTVSDLSALKDLYQTSAAYTTDSYYVTTVCSNPSSVDRGELPESLSFSLVLKHNQQLVSGGDSWIPDDSDLIRYASFLSSNLCFKATLDSTDAEKEGDSDIIGLIIVSVDPWNSSAKVWEFIVDKAHQRSGVGKRLMESVIEAVKKTRQQGRGEGVAAVSVVDRIVCETQTRNIKALSFYFKMGFTLDAVDTSFYSVDDLAKQDVAVFMKLVVKDDGENKAGSDDKNATLRIEDCVNSVCPNSKKPVSPDSLTLYRGRVVGFCNNLCRNEFDDALNMFDRGIAEKNVKPPIKIVLCVLLAKKYLFLALLVLTAAIASADVLRIASCQSGCEAYCDSAKLAFVCWAANLKAPCSALPVSISTTVVPQASTPVITAKFADGNAAAITLSGDYGIAANKYHRFKCVKAATNGVNTISTPINRCQPYLLSSCMSASEYGFDGEFF
ncbi:hypothetical protein BDR26DRAFT_936439 [Obelidium mucronatum]|nr:hypothetical protein BDR26DRAFT_936439 [Obelidium mucronatum]